MSRIFTSLLFCLAISSAFGQTRPVSVFLEGQYNQTIYDASIGNNPLGFGAGLQLFFLNRYKLRPTLEFTASMYGGGDKVLRLHSNGAPVREVESMVNLLVGVSYHPVKPWYFSMMAGTGFVSDRSLFALKPSVGFFFPNNQRWTAKISYLNIFNRDPFTKDDFGTISLAVGIRLF